MKITTKGQVTIPQEIREKTGLLPHTEVTFEILKGRVILKPVGRRTTRGRAAVARLRGSGTDPAWAGKTTAEIMAFLRDDD